MSFDLKSLYLLNANKLLSLARRYVGPNDAEDVVQSTFLRLAEAKPQRPIEDPNAYLFRMSANLAIDHLRSQERKAAREHPDVELDLVPDRLGDPEAIVFSAQQIDRLKDSVSELPDRCREVFILHKFHHLSYADIATRLGISQSTVIKHMVKALSHIKRRLNDVDA